MSALNANFLQKYVIYYFKTTSNILKLQLFPFSTDIYLFKICKTVLEKQYLFSDILLCRFWIPGPCVCKFCQTSMLHLLWKTSRMVPVGKKREINPYELITFLQNSKSSGIYYRWKTNVVFPRLECST